MKKKRIDYDIAESESGGYSISWTARTGRRYTQRCPCDDEIISAYEKLMTEEGGVRRHTKVELWLGLRGIVACGERSQIAGRESLNIRPGRTDYGSEEESRAAVENYWQPKKPRKSKTREDICYNPTQNNNKSVTAFMSIPENKKAYKYTVRHMKGFKAAVKSWFPGLYQHISQRKRNPVAIQSSKEERIARNLVERFNRGQSIYSTFLAHSADPKERELKREVLDCAQEDLFRKKEPYTTIAQRLTELPENVIFMSKGARKHAANLTEDLTAFLFSWRFLLNLPTLGMDTTQPIFRSRRMIKFTHNGRQHEADLRIGNKPIEVKTGLGPFPKYKKQEVIDKYANDHNTWFSGESLEPGIIVFHGKPLLYEQAKPELEATGLEIMTYEDCHNNLKELVQEMKKNSALYRNIRPMMKLDSLVELHEEVSLHPFRLVRDENKPIRVYSQFVLKALGKRARQLRGKSGAQNVFKEFS